jgi:dihydroflavonol-4-reductase
VLGPVLTTDQFGSAGLIKRLLDRDMPAVPRLGFWVVDVRDLADLHLRAMTTPEAAGERFVAVGDFMWMMDIADTLRTGLGERAARVPTRGLPDVAFKALGMFSAEARSLRPLLGRRLVFSSAKARRVLGFAPRPATTTVLDCAESLLPTANLTGTL